MILTYMSKRELPGFALRASRGVVSPEFYRGIPCCTEVASNKL